MEIPTKRVYVQFSFSLPPKLADRMKQDANSKGYKKFADYCYDAISNFMKSSICNKRSERQEKKFHVTDDVTGKKIPCLWSDNRNYYCTVSTIKGDKFSLTYIRLEATQKDEAIKECEIVRKYWNLERKKKMKQNE